MRSLLRGADRQRARTARRHHGAEPTDQDYLEHSHRHAETIIPLLPTEGGGRPMCARAEGGGDGGSITDASCGTPFDGLPWGLWQSRTLLLAAACKMTTAWHMAVVLYGSNPTPFGVFNCSAPVRSDLDWTWDLGDPSGMCVTANESSPSECVPWQGVANVNQWATACSPRLVSSVSQFGYLLGVWLGTALCLGLLPRLGPRRIFLAGLLAEAVLGVLMVFIQLFPIHVPLRFFTAVACVHVFTAGAMLCADTSIGMAKKAVMHMFELGWSLGVVALAGLGVAAFNWTTLIGLMALPSVALLLPCFLLLPESPLWLVSRGRVDEAADLFQKAAVLNGHMHLLPPRPELLRHLRQRHQEAQNDHRAAQNVWRAVSAGGYGAIIRLLLLHLLWCCVINSFYGSLLNVRNLGSSTMQTLTRNVAASGVAGTLGFVIGTLVAVRAARPWMWLGLLLLCFGSAGLFARFIPLEDPLRDVVLLLLVLCQRVGVGSALVALGSCSAGMVPASQRASLIFSCVVTGRAWLLCAPFVGNLVVFGEEYPIAIFGIQISIAGLCSILMAFVGIYSSPPEKSSAQQVYLPHIIALNTPKPT